MLSLNRLEVLVVEDELLSRRALVKALKDSGARVVVASSAEDALVLLEAIRISVALVDLHLPGESGLYLARQFKSRQELAGVPVVLISSDIEPATVQLAFEAGVHDFIRKPVAPMELYARVSAASRLGEELSRRREKERELEISLQYLRQDLDAARRLQRNLLPNAPQVINGIQCIWHFEPCDAVGGDLINYFPLNDREVALFVVDVAGHGVSAALNVMAINALMMNALDRSGVLRDSSGKALPPHEVIAYLNRQMPMDLDAGNYFTMTYCVVDALEHRVDYVQAGQPQAMLSRWGALDLWHEGGHPVGMLPDSHWYTATDSIAVGDQVLIYTDGVTDLTGPRGEHFGQQNLADLLSEQKGKDVIETRQALVDRLQRWQQGIPQRDDISFLLFECVSDRLETSVVVPTTLDGVRELALQLRIQLTAVTRDEALITRADLALTEVATNIVKHGDGQVDHGEMRASFTVGLQRVVVELSDGGPAFDPTTADSISLDDWSIEDAGEDSLALGISMFREIVDEMHYQRLDNRNCLRFSVGLNTVDPKPSETQQ